MFQSLPRYEFIETGVGCAEHSDPTCLCDVVVGTPVPIAPSTVPFMFEDTVLEGLGEYGANARNIYEIASALLGLHETFVDSGADADNEDTMGMAVTARISGTFANPLFADLDERTVRALRAHYRVGSTWDVARYELPDGLSGQTLAALRTEYMTKRRFARHEKKVRLQQPLKSGTKTTCEHCAKVIVNVYGRTRFCNGNCKQAAYRARKAKQ